MHYQKCNNNGDKGFAFNLNNITKAIDDFISGSNLKDVFGADATYKTPAANVLEDEQGLTLELAAPGLNKEDFQLSLEQELLTVSASKNVKKAGENVKVRRNEFNYSTFKRSFRLDIKEFDAQQISARYDNGVLTIRIPRKTEHKSESIKINVL